VSTTLVPGFARFPAAGVCESTVPGASDEATCFSVGVSLRVCNAFTASAAAIPVTSGIATPGGPFETTRTTGVPCGTDFPFFGVCATTIPFGFAAALRVSFVVSFAWRSWNCAA
jgi:hypothetical protein